MGILVISSLRYKANGIFNHHMSNCFQFFAIKFALLRFVRLWFSLIFRSFTQTKARFCSIHHFDVIDQIYEQYFWLSTQLQKLEPIFSTTEWTIAHCACASLHCCLCLLLSIHPPLAHRPNYNACRNVDGWVQFRFHFSYSCNFVKNQCIIYNRISPRSVDKGLFGFIFHIIVCLIITTTSNT